MSHDTGGFVTLYASDNLFAQRDYKKLWNAKGLNGITN